jgi:hypothetical protein
MLSSAIMRTSALLLLFAASTMGLSGCLMTMMVRSANFDERIKTTYQIQDVAFDKSKPGVLILSTMSKGAEARHFECSPMSASEAGTRHLSLDHSDLEFAGDLQKLFTENTVKVKDFSIDSFTNQIGTSGSVDVDGAQLIFRGDIDANFFDKMALSTVDGQEMLRLQDALLDCDGSLNRFECAEVLRDKLAVDEIKESKLQLKIAMNDRLSVYVKYDNQWYRITYPDTLTRNFDEISYHEGKTHFFYRVLCLKWKPMPETPERERGTTFPINGKLTYEQFISHPTKNRAIKCLYIVTVPLDIVTFPLQIPCYIYLLHQMGGMAP